MTELHHKILAAKHGSFDDYIKSIKKQDSSKKSFSSDEYFLWLFQKEKNLQTKMTNLKKRQSNTNNNKSMTEKWFDSKSNKAFLLNRYEGHKWSNVFLRCIFVDDDTFCSTSEDGFLCIWNLNQSLPIQKQQVSNLVLNDVAVHYIKETKQEEIKEEKDDEKKDNEISNSKENEKNTCTKMMIAVGCDDCLVKLL